MAERPTVAHFVFPYLFGTGNWIHGPLVRCQRTRPVVLTTECENLAEFPFAPIHDASRMRLPEKVQLRLSTRPWRGAVDAFFARALRREGARLLHAHFGTVGGRLVDLAADAGLPLVTTFYGADVAQAPRDPVWRARYDRLFAAGARFLAEGPFMADELAAQGCPADRIRVQSIGVDLAGFPFEPRRPAADGIVRILVAGTFRQKKGIPDALRAVRKALPRAPNLAVTLVGDAAQKPGDAEEKAIILDLARALGDACRWAGLVPYSRFKGLYRDHHVMLAPSRRAEDGDSEGGAPVTLIEAQATGMPIVATTHADIPHVTAPGESACLAPEGDVDALAEHLERVASDPALWPAMGIAGRRHVEEQHDIAKQVARLEEQYLEVLAGAR